VVCPQPEIQRKRELWKDQGHSVHGPDPDQKTDPGTEKRQNQALNQELARQPEPRGAQRDTNRQLPAPVLEARGEEGRDVNRGDQEHDDRQSQQDCGQLPVLPFFAETRVFALGDDVEPATKPTMTL